MPPKLATQSTTPSEELQVTDKETLEHAGQEIEKEIECPRCYNVMVLCSDFDSLYYSCEECDFCLYTLSKNKN